MQVLPSEAVRGNLLHANSQAISAQRGAFASRFPIAEIRSLEVGTPRLAKSEEFYIAVWGLKVADGVVYLRASGRDHHVLSLRAHAASEVIRPDHYVYGDAKTPSQL